MENDLSFLDKNTQHLINSAIRKSFIHISIECHKVINKSSVQEGPRGGLRFICAHCNIRCLRNEINVDHIKPCVPLDKSFSEMNLKEFYERCFTTEDNLQILCKVCHKVKSAEEQKVRKHFRGLKKPPKLINKKKAA